MHDFVVFGEFQMKEHAKQVEQVNRRAWMVEGGGGEHQPRRRFLRRQRSA